MIDNNVQSFHDEEEKPPEEAMPILPACLIAANILPMIGDRITWNNLCLISKDIYHQARRSQYWSDADSIISDSSCPWPSTLRLKQPLLANVSTLALSSDNNFLACGSMSQVDVWHKTMGCVRRFRKPLSGSILALSFGSIIRNHPKRENSNYDPRSETFRLAVASTNTNPIVWDLASNEYQEIFVAEVAEGNRATHLAFGRASKHLIYLIAGGYLWKANSISGACDRMFSLGVSRWLTHLVTLSGEWIGTPHVDDSTVQLIKYQHQKDHVLDNHSFDDRNEQLQLRQDDVGNTENNFRRSTAVHHHADCVNVIAVSPAADYTATAGDHGIIQVWDMCKDRKGAVHRLYGLDAHATALAFSMDSRYLAAADVNGYVLVWELNGGKLVADLSGFNRSVKALSFTPRGSMLAAAGVEGCIRFWGRDQWSGVQR